MTDPTITDPVCRCDRCTGEQTILDWPDWAQPSSDWRQIENVKVTEGRL